MLTVGPPAALVALSYKNTLDAMSDSDETALQIITRELAAPPVYPWPAD
ncbi:MAG: hypothetical protein ACJAYU_000230, partial [Bradymonadia bacterium]